MKGKQMLSLLLALFMVLTMLPINARAAETVASGTCGENLTWVLDDEGTLTISGSGAMDDYTSKMETPWCGRVLTKVVIGEGVTTIGNYAFGTQNQILDVIIPKTVVSIGDSAFHGCSSLCNITIPDSVVSLGERAFSHCRSLTGLILPDSVAKIGSFAFASSGLTSVTIPDSVISLGGYTFAYCANLTNVIIGNGVTSIGYGVFFKCNSLTDVIIPDSVTEIGFQAFSECGLTNVTIGSGVTNIDSSAFHYCSDLSNITLPDSVVTIGSGAFGDCSRLTSVTLPDSLTYIGEGAFENCVSLSGIAIPESVTSIGKQAFIGCTALTGILVAPDNVNFSSDGSGVLFNKDQTVLLEAPGGLEGDYTVPDSVVTISAYAFSRCPGVTAVTIPGNVTEIGGYAFMDCAGLKEIHVATQNLNYSSDSAGFLFDKEQTILIQAPGAFEGSYTTPEGVTTIGDSAFAYCTGLTSITFGDDVTTMDREAFCYCTNLVSVAISDGVTLIDYFAFYNCKSLTDVSIPASVATIKVGAFTGCKSLAHVTIPAGVTVIEDSAFSMCGLVEITIPGSVNTISEDAFFYCDNLISVKFESGVTAIKKDAFGECHNLINVIVPDSVTSINEYAFHFSQNITNVFYSGAEEQWKVIVPNSYSVIGLSDAYIHFNSNGEHEAAIGSNNCRYCPLVLSKCADDNNDDLCDDCGKDLGSVVRLAGSNRWSTAHMVANELKASLGVEKFDAIIVASGNDFADALAGSYLASVKKAPILLAWSKGGEYERLDEANIFYIKKNLAPDGTVYILGGESAVTHMYEGLLGGYNVKRLGGENRFETNLLILEEAGVKPGSDILVCTATNFADSLSASATGMPILLVWNERGHLIDGQRDFVSDNRECRYVIVGGENAISEDLATNVQWYAGKYDSAERLAGANRFETSVLLAEKYFMNPETAVLAYAWNYPDGLCGGSLAYSMGVPLILTMTNYEAQASEYAKTADIGGGLVLGGDGLISDEAVRAIFAMDAEDEIILKK